MTYWNNGWNTSIWPPPLTINWWPLLHFLSFSFFPVSLRHRGSLGFSKILESITIAGCAAINSDVPKWNQTSLISSGATLRCNTPWHSAADSPTSFEETVSWLTILLIFSPSPEPSTSSKLKLMIKLILILIILIYQQTFLHSMKGILVVLVELEVPPFLAAYNGHHRRPYFLMDLLYKHPVESGLESQEPHSVNIMLQQWLII